MKQIEGLGLQPDSVLRRSGDVRFRVVDDEGVVVRQAAGEVLVLNAMATRILALADGVAPVDAWVQALFAEYDVDRQVLQRDVLAFAAELLEQGMLEPATALPSPPPATTATATARSAEAGPTHKDGA
jgi:Coenzyme PQQ synthesis protein D (PqqD)